MIQRMTVREAKLRMEVNRMTLRKTGYGAEYRVSFNENERDGTSEPSAYYTDDLEDAVITAGMMRRNKTASLVAA